MLLQGVIFGVALTAHTEAVKLYDLRSFDNGPFASWRLPHPQPLTLSDLTFSNDGLHILLQSLDGLTFMLDAFQGNVVRESAAQPRHFDTHFLPGARIQRVQE